MRCPVCETRTTDHWLRGAIVGALLIGWLAFMAGQLFNKWQYGDVFKVRAERLESVNEELRKGYVPPREVPKVVSPSKGGKN